MSGAPGGGKGGVSHHLYFQIPRWAGRGGTAPRNRAREASLTCRRGRSFQRAEPALEGPGAKETRGASGRRSSSRGACAVATPTAAAARSGHHLRESARPGVLRSAGRCPAGARQRNRLGAVGAAGGESESCPPIGCRSRRQCHPLSDWSDSGTTCDSCSGGVGRDPGAEVCSSRPPRPFCTIVGLRALQRT